MQVPAKEELASYKISEVKPTCVCISKSWGSSLIVVLPSAKKKAKSEESTTVPKTEVSLMATLKSILKVSHEKVHNFTAEINTLTACYQAVFVSIALFPALHLNNGVAIGCQVTAIYRQLLDYKCLQFQADKKP